MKTFKKVNAGLMIPIQIEIEETPESYNFIFPTLNKLLLCDKANLVLQNKKGLAVIPLKLLKREKKI